MSNRKIDSVEFHLLKRSSLGQRLKYFRNEAKALQPQVDYTTPAIAKRVGVSPQTITAIERGESKKPSFYLINQLAKEYGVPLETITDEFYESEERLFSIGTPTSVEVDFDLSELDDAEVITEPDKALGIILYDKKDENTARLLLREEIANFDNDIDLVQLLSRFIYEIEVHKSETSLDLAKLFKKLSPFEYATNLYKVSEESNPYVSKDVIQELIEEMKKERKV
ncbi:helix-turn-helix transcriptional regulator [Alkalibacillus haloalkaliphilus]|uniref:helix-turn-helix transcriptional regulator n=1 Tax=Alkalibacillus haloalkaliphilus TaxID=94136 RepID=UPI0003758F2C|nr:helix-turn-helix transcriptional regulator [Alkalibacillus haloalkaliphilus]